MEYKYIITDINNKIFCCIYTSDNTCHYLKPLDSGSVVGNIYVGRVENVVKNINADPWHSCCGRHSVTR